MEQQFERGTIYTSTLVGYTKIEATEITFKVGPYAQYSDAVHLKFLPKGKRNLRLIQEGFRPRIIVLNGWRHPDPVKAGKEYKPTPGSAITFEYFNISKEGFEENDANFNAFIKEYIEKSGAKILVDTRGHEPKTKWA